MAMNREFWQWVHDRLENAGHWVYRNKLAVRPNVGCAPLGSLVNVGTEVFFVSKSGIMTNAKELYSHTLGHVECPACDAARDAILSMADHDAIALTVTEKGAGTSLEITAPSGVVAYNLKP